MQEASLYLRKWDAKSNKPRPTISAGSINSLTSLFHVLVQDLSALVQSYLSRELQFWQTSYHPPFQATCSGEQPVLSASLPDHPPCVRPLDNLPEVPYYPWRACARKTLQRPAMRVVGRRMFVNTRNFLVFEAPSTTRMASPLGSSFSTDVSLAMVPDIWACGKWLVVNLWFFFFFFFCLLTIFELLSRVLMSIFCLCHLLFF